jgi:hypothetical protein
MSVPSLLALVTASRKRIRLKGNRNNANTPRAMMLGSISEKLEELSKLFLMPSRE